MICHARCNQSQHSNALLLGVAQHSRLCHNSWANTSNLCSDAIAKHTIGSQYPEAYNVLRILVCYSQITTSAPATSNTSVSKKTVYQQEKYDPLTHPRRDGNFAGKSRPDNPALMSYNSGPSGRIYLKGPKMARDNTLAELTVFTVWILDSRPSASILQTQISFVVRAEA